jgi:hypothetical protein
LYIVGRSRHLSQADKFFSLKFDHPLHWPLVWQRSPQGRLSLLRLAIPKWIPSREKVNLGGPCSEIRLKRFWRKKFIVHALLVPPGKISKEAFAVKPNLSTDLISYRFFFDFSTQTVTPRYCTWFSDSDMIRFTWNGEIKWEGRRGWCYRLLAS